MKFSWKAFSFLLGVFAALTAMAGPQSIFNEGTQVYRMNYSMPLVFSAAVPESQYLLMAVKHNSFLIGDLAYIREAANQNAIGSPLRMDGDVKITHIEKRADGSAEVTYQYDGEVVLNRTGLSSYLLYLPTDYESLPKLDKSELGVCSIYKSANSIPILEILINYWNPFVNARCRIPYSEIRASLTPVFAKNTYPDYPRLVKNGEITISIFLGKMRANDSNTPATSVFDGATTGAVLEYQKVTKNLRRLGFVRTEVIRTNRNQTNYQERYELGTARANFRIHLVYGDSVHQGPAMDEYNALYVKAAEQDSVVIYSGHSGFLVDASGLKLYPDMQVQFDPDRYQIFTINGCQTNYYLYPLFQKKSTKNMDIFLNALETLPNAEGTYKPIEAMVNWARENRWTSFQELIRQMDAENGMMGVAGEQDNPTVPY